MINSYLSRQITQNFPYDPTEDQVLALNLLSNFLLSEESDSLLLLKGYAGTGKTSLVGALVKTDRKSTRLNSSHKTESRMPSSA